MTHNIRFSVRVRNWPVGHVGGATELRHGTRVLLLDRDTDRLLAHTTIWSLSRYEPERRNVIGGLGAYVDVPADREMVLRTATELLLTQAGIPDEIGRVAMATLQERLGRECL